MKKQDTLWESGCEDLEEVERLFHEITYEAKRKGFDGYVNIYNCHNEEVIAEIFESKSQFELAIVGLYDNYESTSTCRMLIDYLEKIVNKK